MKRFVMKSCIITFAMSLAFAVRGAMMCSGTSVSVTLDLATGTRMAAASETIRYSIAWVDGAVADAEAVVEVNGEALNVSTGSGYVDWIPSWNGTFTLTHRVMSGGEQIGETLTATFAVEGMMLKEPVISPVGGTVFEGSLPVTMSCPTEGATIHFTTDGSEPTAESPVYKRFKIYGKTTVKAVAVKDGLLSEVVTAEYALGQCADPVIDAAATFTGSKTKVAIACATEGVVVRYTLDGSEPNSHSTKYTGPFYVTDSCTVKAYAVMPDYLNSGVATFAIEKVWTIGDTMGKPAHAFTTGGDGDVGWTRVTDSTAPDGEAMKSGNIGNSSAYGSFARTVLSTTVMGPGTVSFSWKASCEDDAPAYEWDHGEFAVDGVVKAYISGETDWTNVCVAVTGPGEHALTWTYLKDDVELEGEDCIWVCSFGWESAEPYTHTTDVPVPYAWLAVHDPDVVDEYEAFEAAANATAANGRDKVWECYVAGISPVDPAAKFTAKIEMKDGGPVVTWEPDLNAGGAAIRVYKVYGSETLVNGGNWQYPTNSLYRFFKVKVEMP